MSATPFLRHKSVFGIYCENLENYSPVIGKTDSVGYFATNSYSEIDTLTWRELKTKLALIAAGSGPQNPAVDSAAGIDLLGE